MLLKLYRDAPQGESLFGELYVEGKRLCDTLEPAAKAIPAGFYPLTLTYSPRFGTVLPLVGNVVGCRVPHTTPTHRQGIRIHGGNTVEHTTGCILVGVADTLNGRLLSSKRTLAQLMALLLEHHNTHKLTDHEPIYLQVIERNPYPLYDVPCPARLQGAEPSVRRLCAEPRDTQHAAVCA